jgi:hypothetical protein
MYYQLPHLTKMYLSLDNFSIAKETKNLVVDPSIFAIVNFYVNMDKII